MQHLFSDIRANVNALKKMNFNPPLKLHGSVNVKVSFWTINSYIYTGGRISTTQEL